MAIDYPSTPSLNQIYTYGGLSWQWNGSAWDSLGFNNYSIDGGGPSDVFSGSGPFTLDGGTP